MASFDDRFQNILAAEVVQPSADALTFAQVNTGVSLGQGLGMVIDAMDFWPSSTVIKELITNTDSLDLAWTTSDQITDLQDEADSRIIDVIRLVPAVAGTAGNVNVIQLPLHREYTPPRIMASTRLFLAVDSNGFAAAGTIRSRLAFRFIKLSTAEYLEIAETFMQG